MRRTTKLLPALFVVACGEPPGDFPPFIHVTVVDPEGFIAPPGERWEVTTAAILNGNPISNVNEVPNPANPLPSDLTVSFSEQVRGQNVTVRVEGFTDGVSVFSASGAAIAGSSELEVVARFCGDNTIDEDRNEACDDGFNNSDTLPDACRSSCQLPACGDGVHDVLAGEECDDGNLIDADGCEADCTLPACGNGIFEPEDFRGFLDGGPAGGCFRNTNSQINIPGQSTDIKVIDIDQDGHLDIVSGISESQTAVFAFGNGDGTFDPPLFISGFSGHVALASGKFNNDDNFVDFAGVSSQQDLRGEVGIIDFNNSDRSFDSRLVTDTCNFSGNCSSGTTIKTNDFDGDSIDDLLIISDRAYYVDKTTQDNLNQLPALPYIPEGVLIDVQFVDINLDGNKDVILFDQLTTQTKAIVLTSQGTDIFTLSSTFTFNFINNIGINRTTTIDFNKDGILDIASVDSIENKIVLIPGKLGAGFQGTIQKINSSNCLYLIANDLDFDSFDDLICIGNIDFNTEGSSIIVFLSTESFSQEHKFVTSSSRNTAIGLGDFDEDGFFDVVVADSFDQVSGSSFLRILTFNP